MPSRPEGLTYVSEFITRDAERDLVANIEALTFQEVRTALGLRP
jgi:hypothetical protein